MVLNAVPPRGGAGANVVVLTAGKGATVGGRDVTVLVVDVAEPVGAVEDSRGCERIEDSGGGAP